jgi:hypothetical protein
MSSHRNLSTQKQYKHQHHKKSETSTRISRKGEIFNTLFNIEFQTPVPKCFMKKKKKKEATHA